MPETMQPLRPAKGETIIQVYGMGPFVLNYVNPTRRPEKEDEEPNKSLVDSR